MREGQRIMSPAGLAMVTAISAGADGVNTVSVGLPNGEVRQYAESELVEMGDGDGERLTVIDAEKFKQSIFIAIKVRGLYFRRQEKDGAKLFQYFEQYRREIAERKARGEEVPAGGSMLDLSAADLASMGSNKKRATATTKRLLQSDKLDALWKHLNDTKAKITAPVKYGGMANPSYMFEGIYEISPSKVQEAKAVIAEGQRRLTESWQDDEGKTHPGYLTDFLDDYELAIARAENAPLLEGGLGPLFDRSDYPTAADVMRAFSITKRLIGFTVPEGLSSEDRAEAKAELRADLIDAGEQIKLGLRAGFQELIEHGREILTTKDGEKPKVIKASMLGNLLQFCETFSSRNTQSDTELAALVEQAKQVFSGMDPDKLRKYASQREQAREAFNDFAKRIDEMVVTQKGRVIDLSE